MSDFSNAQPAESDVVSEFESAWKSGVVRSFVDSIPSAARENTDLLTELACIDLENRLKQEQETNVEFYTTEFPQLANDELVLLELIRTERAFRSDRDSLTAESYCKRFPQLRRHIEMMFQLEFNRSGTTHTREENIDWQCASCGAVVECRDATITQCPECRQPVEIGRYELIERVGHGAFGNVYRARDPKLDREVAVKLPRSQTFLLPEETERFLRESRNAAQLDHPGIVRIFDTGRHDGLPYIVSEFVDGEPLSSVVSEREFEFREAAQATLQIARAVEHAHERGVIHRDLKPSNVMADEDGGNLSLRVMDFGLARREQADVTVTMEGQAIGTPAYMSPEQARGDLDAVGEQSDIYSIGVILFQLLCGEVPFRGNVQMLIQQVINDDPPSPSRFRNRIPRDLETICMKAIQREPGQRYESVSALANDIDRWLNGKPVHARRVGTIGRVWRWCKRRPAVAALLAGLTVSIVGGTTGVMYQWQEAEVARKASEADLRDALESVDKVLGHLGSDTLADVPQAKQLREEVLNDALAFFQRFRLRNPDDPRVAMQVASAHYQVARIQSALGKKDEAASAYEDAVTVYESIKDNPPSRKEWLDQCALAHSGYAALLRGQGETDKAREQQQRCVDLRKARVELSPEYAGAASKYASAKADLARTLGDQAELEARTDEAVAELEKLVATNEEIGFKRDLARVLNNYAIRLAKLGAHGKAEGCRERAIELYEAVVADDPSSESKRALYANCCLRLVETLREESRLAAAEKYQKKAVDAYRSLTEDFPATPKHRVRYADTLAEVGDFARSQKRYENAVDAFANAVRQQETLVALFPANKSYQRSLTVDLGRLGNAYAKLDNAEKVEECFRRRVELRRVLAREGNDRDKIYCSTALRSLASHLRRSGSGSDSKEAEMLVEEADELLEGISVEAVMKSGLSTASKVRMLESLITAATGRNDRGEIEGAYRAKIELYERQVRQDPKRLSRRERLAKTWFQLGKVFRSWELREQAIEPYREAIRLDEQLLLDDPDSATYMSQFLAHASVLGQALTGLRRNTEAIEVLRRSLRIANRLFEERKNEGFRQARVVLAYLQLGNAIALESENFDEALEAYEQALSLSGVLKDQRNLAMVEGLVENTIAWFLVTCPDESLRDPIRALEISRRFAEKNSDNARYLSTLAFALFETGEYAESIDRFTQSTDGDATFGALNTVMVAMAQAKLGQTADAKVSYQKAIELHESKPDIEPELFEVYRAKAEQLILD